MILHLVDGWLTVGPFRRDRSKTGATAGSDPDALRPCAESFDLLLHESALVQQLQIPLQLRRVLRRARQHALSDCEERGRRCGDPLMPRSFESSVRTRWCPSARPDSPVRCSTSSCETSIPAARDFTTRSAGYARDAGRSIRAIGEHDHDLSSSPHPPGHLLTWADPSLRKLLICYRSSIIMLTV